MSQDRRSHIEDSHPRGDIAVIGMACRFPRAPTVGALWRLIERGEVCFEPIRQERWDHRPFYAPTDPDPLDKADTDRAAFIDDIDLFAAEPFGLSPRRVEVMDPQHRLVLETVREALDDAGYVRHPVNKKTGVFLGVGTSEYRDVLLSRLRGLQATRGEFGDAATSTEVARVRKLFGGVAPMRTFTMVGVLLNMTAAAVSQALDLTGPSLTLDTACSAGLVAVHHAMLELRTGSCNVAIAGGAYLNLVPDSLVGFSRIGAISSTGQCRPFDASANGFVMGEGVGTVVLKRLKDALADGDAIWAVLKGSACNNNGRESGPMAPGVRGELEVLEQALEDAQVPLGSIRFIEAHGTGTEAGDQAEVRSLKQLFERRRGGRCHLSSIKANIGHTMQAAGMAGLIKAILVMHHRLVPPQAGFERPHPALALEDSPFAIAREAVALEPFDPGDPSNLGDGQSGEPLRAGVSSFGFGGTNAHVILEAWPSRSMERNLAAHERAPELFVVSAPSAAMLVSHARSVADELERAHGSAAHAAALLAGRTLEQARVAVVAASCDQAADALRAAALKIKEAGAPLRDGVKSGEATTSPKLVFLLPDSTSAQAPANALRDLYERVPAARRRVDVLAAAAKEATGRSILSALQLSPPDEETPTAPRTGAGHRAQASASGSCRDQDAELHQAAAVAMAIALGELLMATGVVPSMILGIGLGELAAAALAGALSAEAAVVFAVERAHQTASRKRTLATELPFCKPRIDLMSFWARRCYRDEEELRERWAGQESCEVDPVATFEAAMATGGEIFVEVGQCTDFARRLATAASCGDKPGRRSFSVTSTTEILAMLGELINLGGGIDPRPISVAGAHPAIALPPTPLVRARYWAVTRGTVDAAQPLTATPLEAPAPLPTSEPTASPGGGGLTPRAVILAEVARIGAFPIEAIDGRRKIVSQLGFDSTMVLELSAELMERFPTLQVEDDFFADDPPLESLIGRIEERLGIDATPSRATDVAVQTAVAGNMQGAIDEAAYRIDRFPEYVAIKERLAAFEKAGFGNPFSSLREGVADGKVRLAGKEVSTFSNFNYLGFSGEPAIAQAAKRAIDEHGASVCASRLASGERPIHRELERAIAGFLGTEAALTFVSGHGTNMYTVARLVGPGDLVLHDAFAHDSLVQGALLSGAKRVAFPHNDPDALEAIVAPLRPHYRRVLILIEGVYSMDGDFPDLPRFVAVKRAQNAMLMIDEAHSLGVLGKTGRGIAEHFGVERNDVEVWMGTLSKALASSGGYIAGSSALIDYLRFTAGGFIFATAIPPMNVAAARASLELLAAEPERVAILRSRADLLRKLFREAGFDIGKSEGSAVVPCLVRDSALCMRLARMLAERQIDVQPIVYPAVEEKASRLRFFVTCKHSEMQIREAVAILRAVWPNEPRSDTSPAQGRGEAG